MTLQQITRRLSAAGIENSAHEARLLVSHVTGLSPDRLRLMQDVELPDPDGTLERLVTSREGRYPLQYLLGTWGFWRQEYEVSPDCLIPRSDTECLLETALSLVPTNGRFLDVCTGSGCIAISLVCERPDVSAVAVDLYENTLALARRNVQRNGVDAHRLRLCRGDALVGDFIADADRFDLILSNPPYIPSGRLSTLQPEVGFEPSAALDGGEDGLRFYRAMLQLPRYRNALRPGGSFVFEIGYDQADALIALAEQCGDACCIRHDLNGLPRVAVVTPVA